MGQDSPPMSGKNKEDTFMDSVIKVVFVILMWGLAISVVVWMIRWAWNYPL